MGRKKIGFHFSFSKKNIPLKCYYVSGGGGGGGDFEKVTTMVLV